MNFRTATYDLAKLNSITKYPSIPTLHALGPKGVPTDELLVDFDGCDVYVTEKVDGTNARVIMSEGQYAIGSRENLLTLSGDVLFDPAQGIVPALRTLGVADRATGYGGRGLLVIWGEVYGGKVTAASKQYTSDPGRYGFRIFDAAVYSTLALDTAFGWSREEIASWRDGERDDFAHVDQLPDMALFLRCGQTPRVEAAGAPPTDRRHVYEWLRDVLPASLSTLDETAAGYPEGVVVRTPDRRRIAKVRLDDYRRARP